MGGVGGGCCGSVGEVRDWLLTHRFARGDVCGWVTAEWFGLVIFAGVCPLLLRRQRASLQEAVEALKVELADEKEKGDKCVALKRACLLWISSAQTPSLAHHISACQRC